MTDSLGDRMKKNYEDISRIKLTRRMPVILRLDGRAFHTLTRSADKPFDTEFIRSMQKTTENVIRSIQGAKAAYTQSDEISVLITDFDTIDTNAWFDYNIQKMVSISAATAAVNFNRHIAGTKFDGRDDPPVFDARAFNIPKEEVLNYFIWRYQDWVRNSLQMLARAHYSHKQLDKKGHVQMHEMLHEKGINWADLCPLFKNGSLYLNGTDGSGWSYWDEFDLKDKRWRPVFDGLMTPKDKE